MPSNKRHHPYLKKNKKVNFKYKFKLKKYDRSVLQKTRYNERSFTNTDDSCIPSQQKLSLKEWGLPEPVYKAYEAKKIFEMFPWQLECLLLGRILSGENLVYSAPTSAGKTLVAEILMIKTVFERRLKAIVILPFVSVVREKTFYFQDLLGDSGIRVEGLMGGHCLPGGFSSVDIAICTIEKANGLINRLLEEDSLDDVGCIVIDELHMIGDPFRGYLLELLLTKIKFMCHKKPSIKIQVVGMSATLPNLSLLAEWLNAQIYTTNFRPVPLLEFVKMGPAVFSKDMKKLYDVVPDFTIKDDPDNIVYLCLETIFDGKSVLIFCPTKAWCENLALNIARDFYNIGNSKCDAAIKLEEQLGLEGILEVIEQLKRCPSGLDKTLHRAVAFGVAFHHAGLTLDERDIIEGSFHSGKLRVLVATSTLSSGVNLPARRVIVRSPLFNGRPLDFQTYKQMIGRAGRMGKDTQGESFLVCQPSEKHVVEELMKSSLKPVSSCLDGDLSSSFKRAILEVIVSGVASTLEEVKNYTSSTLFAITKSDVDKYLFSCLKFLEEYELIKIQSSNYISTPLGAACLSAALSPDQGLELFEELQRARQCFVLDNDLHIIYLVTPFSVSSQIGNLDWVHVLELWEKLPAGMRRVADLVGIEEKFMVRAMRKTVNFDDSKQVRKLSIHRRFYTALALQDLVNEVPLQDVAAKFHFSRGMLQSLQQSAATFAGMVTAFCNRLRWSSFELLVSQFQDRLHFGVQRELCDLLKLSSLNGPRARALFNSGLTSVAEVANSDINTIENALLGAVPFETAKEMEGETIHDKSERNKLRNFWVTGKQGLTGSDVAAILIKEAKDLLRLELGLLDVKWKSDKLKTPSQENNNSTVVEKQEEYASISSTQEETTNSSKEHSSSLCDNSLKNSQTFTNDMFSELNCENSLDTSNSKHNYSVFDPKILNEFSTSFEVNIPRECQSENICEPSADDTLLTFFPDIACINDSLLQLHAKQESTCSLKSEALSISKSGAIFQEKQSCDINVPSPKLDLYSISDYFDSSLSVSDSKLFSNKLEPDYEANKNSPSLPSNANLSSHSMDMFSSPDTTCKDSTMFRDSFLLNTQLESVLNSCEVSSNKSVTVTPSKSSLTLEDVSRTKKEIPINEDNDIDNVCFNKPNCGTAECTTPIFDTKSMNHNVGRTSVYRQPEMSMCNYNYSENLNIQSSNSVLESPSGISVSCFENRIECRTKSTDTSLLYNVIAQEIGNGKTNDKPSCSPEHPTEKQEIYFNNEDFNISFNDSYLDKKNKTYIQQKSISKTKDCPLKESRSTYEHNIAETIQIKGSERTKFKPKDNNSEERSISDDGNEEIIFDSSDEDIVSFTSSEGQRKNLGSVDGIHVVEVCEQRECYNMFLSKLKLGQHISFSLGGRRIIEPKPTLSIGDKIIGKQIKKQDGEKHIFTCGDIAVVGFAVCFGGNTVYYINLEKNSDTLVSIEDKLHLLKLIITDTNITKSLRIISLKEQYKVLAKTFKLTIKVSCLEDPIIAEWLIHGDTVEKSLNCLCHDYYCQEFESFMEYSDYLEGWKSFGLQTRSDLSALTRSCIESVICFYVLEQQHDKLIKKNLLRHFQVVEMPTVLCLAHMELCGIGFCRDKLESVKWSIQVSMESLQEKAFKLAGHRFSLSSPSDVHKVVYTELKLKPKSSSKPSTNKIALAQLKNQHPLPDIIINWRKMNSIMVKTVYPLLKKGKTNRIFSNSIMTTATGRISMCEPNLQNVPRDFQLSSDENSDLLISVRDAFESSEGKTLVSADFRQLELRILGILCGEHSLYSNYSGDLFRTIGSSIYGIPAHKISDIQRQQAKQICYGMIYGMSARSLSEQLNINEREASEFKASFFSEFPNVKKYFHDVVTKCRNLGYVETIYSRRRYISDMSSFHRATREQAVRQAINTTIQGSAADIVKTCMIQIEKKIRSTFPNLPVQQKTVLQI